MPLFDHAANRIEFRVKLGGERGVGAGIHCKAAAVFILSLIHISFRKAYPDINEVYAVDLETAFIPGTVDYANR